MAGRRVAGRWAALLALVGLASLVVFAASYAHDWRADEMQWFERAARLTGYALTLAVTALTAASALRCRRGDGLGRAAAMALYAAYAAVVLLCAHDVLLYAEYGEQLEGTFTMTAFFALDAGLLLLYPACFFLRRGRGGFAACRGALWGVALLWAIYAVGDLAGYPASRLYDWDETFTKLAPMCNALFVIRMTGKGGVCRGGDDS